MKKRYLNDFGQDYEPYLRNLKKKWGGVKLILLASSLFLAVFIVFIYVYQTNFMIAMTLLAAVMCIGSLYIHISYMLLTRPEKHFIEKRLKIKDLQKLERTELRKWAERNKMLIRKDAGVRYYYYWYAYFYVPVYFVIKLDMNYKMMSIYYLWPRQYLVVSPDHPNISSAYGLYKVRRREVEKDRKILAELDDILD